MAAALAAGFRLRWRLPPRVALAIGLGALAVALIYAWQLRWLSDDAFISFRYARNWARGDGLVFNLGETVEGYTNFLWTAILAGAYSIGLGVAETALLACLACYAGVLVAAQSLWVRLSGDPEATLSLGAIALAFSYTFASFATGGLETMFTTLLVVLALLAAMSGRTFWAGLAGIAATMAHPDHAIFYVALGVALLGVRTPFRALLGYAAPFFIFFVPYYLIRWDYYGYFFPNTYYAKGAGESYFTQGGFYLLVSGLAAGLLFILPLFVYGLTRVRDRLVLYYAVIAVPLYLGYVAKIGGCFMLGRLMVPIMPLGFVVGELGVRALLRSPQRTRFAVGAAAMCIASVAAIPLTPVFPHEYRWHVTDERTFYRIDSLFPVVLAGKIPNRVHAIARGFEGANPPPSYAAFAIGYIGWVTDWRIVDIHGIIDPDLAHQPLEKRGRPGHERQASAKRIVEAGATISSIGVNPGEFAKITEVWFGEQGYVLARYVPETMRHLRGADDVRYTEFEPYLDDYIAGLAGKRVSQIRRHLAFFDRYYFDHANDPARRKAIADHLAARRPRPRRRARD